MYGMFEDFDDYEPKRVLPEPWNKGRLVGQKPPFKPPEVWAIRIRLDMEHQHRDLALFNLAIDSKLRACDLVKLRVQDVCRTSRVASRAIVMQQKTNRPVQFEITEQTRAAISAWIQHKQLTTSGYLFPSRVRLSRHLSRRQYARLLAGWLTDIGLDPATHGELIKASERIADGITAGYDMAAGIGGAKGLTEHPGNERRPAARDRAVMAVARGIGRVAV